MVSASRVLGDQVGSTAPLFLAVLAVHVLAGLIAAGAGAIAALTRKGSTRHVRAGRWYYRAISGRAGVTLSREVISDESEAAHQGMHGSPTLLIDGADPFAGPGQPPSMACPLYRDADGRARRDTIRPPRRPYPLPQRVRRYEQDFWNAA